MHMMNRIYLDHAATTPLSPAVLEKMLPWWTERYGNSSSVHGTGREARRAVDQARRQVAEAIGAQPREIYFTSGGTESDNWALTGTALALRGRGNHIITTSVEHHAVLRPCEWLETQGFRVTYLPVDGDGRVDPEEAERAVTDQTILLSVMTANNEVGTVQPVAVLGEMARRRGILFHTDAVQAAGTLPLDVNALGVDFLSLSAHKFYGPKGVGVLYVRQGTRLNPLIRGGEQERGLRAGTENVAGIVGLGEALRLALEGREAEEAKIRGLRDRLIRAVLERIPGSRLNGHPTERLPGNCNFSFDGVEGEALLLRLDLAGIAASGGSACTAGSQEPSHVLRAMGRTETEAAGSLRLTLGRENTAREIDETAETLAAIVQDLRRLRGDTGFTGRA